MTTDQKHTNLPWSLSSLFDNHGLYIEDAAGLSVCDFYFRDMTTGKIFDHPNAEKNAQLILSLAAKVKELGSQLRYLAAVSQQYIDHVEGLSPAFTGDQEYDEAYREGLSEDMRIAIENALARIEAEKAQ